MPRNDNMQWLRLSNPEDLEGLLRPALEQAQFNTCSGLGYREKRLGRLLTLIGHRGTGDDTTTQVLGLTFAEKPSLQQKALDLIAEVYANRHNGQSIYTWLPKSMED